jgi:hypothetical protein
MLIEDMMAVLQNYSESSLILKVALMTKSVNYDDCSEVEILYILHNYGDSLISAGLLLANLKFL